MFKQQCQKFSPARTFVPLFFILEFSWSYNPFGIILSKYGSSIIVNFLLFYINNYRVSKHFFPSLTDSSCSIFLWLLTLYVWLLLSDLAPVCSLPGECAPNLDTKSRYAQIEPSSFLIVEMINSDKYILRLHIRIFEYFIFDSDQAYY